MLDSMLLRSRLALRGWAPRRYCADSHRSYKACLIDTPRPTRPLCPLVSFRTMTMMQQAGPEAAHRLLDFVNASPTPYHAVRAASARLENAGFQKVAGWSRLSDWTGTHNVCLRSGSKTIGTRASRLVASTTLLGPCSPSSCDWLDLSDGPIATKPP